jgi:hypothetical protein
VLGVMEPTEAEWGMREVLVIGGVRGHMKQSSVDASLVCLAANEESVVGGEGREGWEGARKRRLGTGSVTRRFLMDLQ